MGVSLKAAKASNGSRADALQTDLRDVVDAIQDLTRVAIALSGRFESKSDAIRHLHDLAIPTGRIAAILAIKPADVASAIAKYKKRAAKKSAEVVVELDEEVEAAGHV